jgi:hypothetical protein
VESALYYGYYQQWNMLGYGSQTFIAFVLLVSAAKAVLCFFTLTLITKMDIRSNSTYGSRYIKFLGISMFSSLYIFRLVCHLASLIVLEVLTAVPAAIAFGFFYYAVLQQIKQSISQLLKRGQTVLAYRFKMLRRILYLAGLTLIAFVISDLFVSTKVSDLQWLDGHWEMMWFLQGAWFDVLFLVCFVWIAVLWRPVARVQRTGLYQVDDGAFDPTDVQMEDVEEHWDVQF